MGNLFLSVLEISFSASLTVLLLVLSAPLLNRRYAAKWKCWIWIFLAVRLMIPASGEGILEKITPQEEIRNERNAEVRPEGTAQRVIAAIPRRMTAPIAVQENQKGISVSLLDIIAAVWLCGCGLFLAVHIGSFRHYRKWMLKSAVPVRDGCVPGLMVQLEQELHLKRKVPVLECALAASPMMTGAVHPVLLLPHGQYSRQELYFILKHELVHLKHRDLYWKMLLLAANAVHWFNPFIWLMQKEAAADMELACDESVTHGAGSAGCRAYTEALLSAIQRNCAKGTAFTTQFYGGKQMMKKRFQNILIRTEKKNGAAVLAGAMILTVCLGAAAGCAVKKQDTGEQENRTGQRYASNGQPASDNSQKEREKDQISSADSRQDAADGQSVSDNIQQPEGVDGEHLYSQMAGIWMIDFDETDTSLWGTGISYGNEMEISETGEFRYYIGIGNGGTGQCEQAENGVTVEIEPYEQHSAEPEILALDYDGSSTQERIHMDWHGEDVWWKRAESTGSSQAEPFIMLSFQKEGIEERKRASLAAGDGFSIYLPDGEWQENGPDRWRAAANNQVQLWTERCEGISSIQAEQDFAGQGYTLSDGAMVKQEGGSITKVNILQSKNTIWKVFYSYPAEAEEGWGSELQVIADTFAVSASESSSPGLSLGKYDLIEIRQIIDQFMEAYFLGNRDEVQKFLSMPYEWDIDVHQGDSTISGLKIKGLPDEWLRDYGDGTYGASLEFRDSAYPDTFQYMEIIFLQQEGAWKISSYGLTG